MGLAVSNSSCFDCKNEVNLGVDLEFNWIKEGFYCKSSSLSLSSKSMASWIAIVLG